MAQAFPFQLSRKTRIYEGEFIRGPMPVKWFQRASELSATAGVIGLILWQKAYKSGLFGPDNQNRTSRRMKLTNRTCGKWGISASAKLRTLKAMAEVGLIHFEVKTGSSPLAQIIDDEVK